MKLQIKIKEVTHDELVNLFSTATYGSSWLVIRNPKGSYKGTALEDENDSCEDSWTKVLLNGGTIYCYDNYAEDEDEFYGNLPHKFTDYGMRYELTLKDLIKGLEYVANKDNEYNIKCFNDWRTEANDFDFLEADNLIQCVLFGGEAIYG